MLYKIHGTAEDDDSVIMTRVEYDKAAASPAYQQTMRHLLQSYTFLLVGYGINDPLDLDLVFGLNKTAFGSATKRHYALMKDARQADRDRWSREMNIQVIPYADHGDLPAILRALAQNPPKPSLSQPPSTSQTAGSPHQDAPITSTTGEVSGAARTAPEPDETPAAPSREQKWRRWKLGVGVLAFLLIPFITYTFFWPVKCAHLAPDPPNVSLDGASPTKRVNLCAGVPDGACLSEGNPDSFDSVRGLCTGHEMDGEWQGRLGNAQLWEGIYCKGRPCGTFHVYHGNRISEIKYGPDGRPTGQWRTWRQDGSTWIWSSGEMSAKGKQGYWASVLEPNILLVRGKYLDGKMIGRWEYGCANKHRKFIDDPDGPKRKVWVQLDDGQLVPDPDESLCPSPLKKR